MEIALIAPIAHAFPPPGYGPWERVAYEEAEGLVGLGHRVSVFGAAGSSTSAELVETVEAPLDQTDADPRLTETQHIFTAAKAIAEGGFDVIHSHLHVHALGFAPFFRSPLVSTLHGVAWDRAHHQLLLQHRHERFVSISDSERRFLPELNYIGTVYNGSDFAEFPVNHDRDDYLLYAGRLAPEKGPDLALETARLSGRPLRLAGMVENKHRAYFESEIEPHLGPQAEYLGPISRPDLIAQIASSAALLMPLRWEEPFGLVVIEAMATGAPVIAWRRGAMAELIDDSCGMLVESAREAAEAAGKLDRFDADEIANYVRKRFSREEMSLGYASVLESSISR